MQPARTVAFFAAILAALAMAGSSAAQAQAKPTPEQIAGAKAEADVILQKANAADLFDNVTDTNLPTLRHRASGLVCSFEPGAAINHVTIYAGLPRGDDVSCETKAADFDQSIYATRWAQPVDTDQALQIAVSALHQRWPAAEPYKGMIVNTTSNSGQPPHRSVRFVIENNGRKLFIRASTSTIGAWSVLERTTGPAENASAGDLLGELVMVNTLDKMTGHKAP